MSNFLDEFKTKIQSIIGSSISLEPVFNTSSTLPRCCYFVVNAEPIDASLDGTHGDRDYEFQLDAFAADADEAWNIVESCRTSLENTVLEVWGEYTAVDIFDCKTFNSGESPQIGNNQVIHQATLLVTITVRRN